MPVKGRDLSSRQTQYVVKDMEIGQPINSKQCSETADGVARESKGVEFVREKLWGGRRRSWHLHRPYELMEIAPWELLGERVLARALSRRTMGARHR